MAVLPTNRTTSATTRHSPSKIPLPIRRPRLTLRSTHRQARQLGSCCRSFCWAFCDNNNNYAAAAEGPPFCWASARAGWHGPAFQARPCVSDQFPLRLRWRWSVTGINARYQCAQQQGPPPPLSHSLKSSFFSPAFRLSLLRPPTFRVAIQEKNKGCFEELLLAGQIIPCSSKCLLASPFILPDSPYPPAAALALTRLPLEGSRLDEAMAISVGGYTLREVHCDALKAH